MSQERYIVAVNVERSDKVVSMGAVWAGTALVAMRGRAQVFYSLEEAESQRFYITCKYLEFVGRVEVVRLEVEHGEIRYHLRGGEDVE